MENLIDLNNLSEEEKQVILNVIKRDEEVKQQQDNKVVQLRMEINNLRKQSILRGDDDSNKMCIRCRKPFGFFFDTGDFCSHCKYKICNNCRETLVSNGWLCCLCYKQMQLKWLTGEWIYGTTKKCPKFMPSGGDVIKASIRKTTGNRNITRADDNTDGGAGISKSNSAVSHREDLDRITAPQESDKKRLSHLFNSLKPGRSEASESEVSVQRISCRRRVDSDSDTSSSDGGEQEEVIKEPSASHRAMKQDNMQVSSETESVINTPAKSPKNSVVDNPMPSIQENNNAVADDDGCEYRPSCNLSEHQFLLSNSTPLSLEKEISSSLKKSEKEERFLHSNNTSPLPAAVLAHPKAESKVQADSKTTTVQRSSSGKSDASSVSLSSARTASPATKMRLLDMASMRALERDISDHDECASHSSQDGTEVLGKHSGDFVVEGNSKVLSSLHQSKTSDPSFHRKRSYNAFHDRKHKHSGGGQGGNVGQGIKKWEEKLSRKPISNHISSSVNQSVYEDGLMPVPEGNTSSIPSTGFESNRLSDNVSDAAAALHIVSENVNNVEDTNTLHNSHFTTASSVHSKINTAPLTDRKSETDFKKLYSPKQQDSFNHCTNLSDSPDKHEDPFLTRVVRIPDIVQQYLDADNDLSDCLSVITEATEPTESDDVAILTMSESSSTGTIHDEELDKQFDEIYSKNLKYDLHLDPNCSPNGNEVNNAVKVKVTKSHSWKKIKKSPKHDRCNKEKDQAKEGTNVETKSEESDETKNTPKVTEGMQKMEQSLKLNTHAENKETNIIKSDDQGKEEMCSERIKDSAIEEDITVDKAVLELNSSNTSKTAAADNLLSGGKTSRSKTVDITSSVTSEDVLNGNVESSEVEIIIKDTGLKPAVKTDVEELHEKEGDAKGNDDKNYRTLSSNYDNGEVVHGSVGPLNAYFGNGSSEASDHVDQALGSSTAACLDSCTISQGDGNLNALKDSNMLSVGSDANILFSVTACTDFQGDASTVVPTGAANDTVDFSSKTLTSSSESNTDGSAKSETDIPIVSELNELTDSLTVSDTNILPVSEPTTSPVSDTKTDLGVKTLPISDSNILSVSFSDNLLVPDTILKDSDTTTLPVPNPNTSPVSDTNILPISESNTLAESDSNDQTVFDSEAQSVASSSLLISSSFPCSALASAGQNQLMSQSAEDITLPTPSCLPEVVVEQQTSKQDSSLAPFVKVTSETGSDETGSHGGDSGHLSSTSADNTPEHAQRSPKHLSIPSLVCTSVEENRYNEEDEDIDDMVSSLASRNHLRSHLTDSRESLYSIYSDAGEINYGKIPVSGEILFGLDYNYRSSALEIYIKQCKDLAPVDTKRNRSDPYVKTYLLPDKTRSGKRKTKIKKHTLNPTFDEVLRYVISKSEVENRVLWVTVWHNDPFGRNDFLGEVMISLECYKFGDSAPRWYLLQERLELPEHSLCYKGDLVLSLKYVTPDQTESPSKKGKSKKNKESSKGELHVFVKESHNLTAVRSNGTSDPFCKGYLLPEKNKSVKQKTPVVKRNCNPEWNHIFVFEDVSLEELRQRSLELTIWDYDRLTSNDFLGGVRLNLGTGVYGGQPVDWMDARGEEVYIWKSIFERPNIWIQATVGLRHTMGKSEIKK